MAILLSSRDLTRQISNGVALIRCALSALKTWSPIFIFGRYPRKPISHASLQRESPASGLLVGLSTASNAHILCRKTIGYDRYENMSLSHMS